MINFMEHFQPVQAVFPTSANGARVGDYVLMENCHAIWCVTHFGAKVSGGCVITHEVARDFAGTGSTVLSTGIQTWSAIGVGTTQNVQEVFTARTSSPAGYALPASAAGSTYSIVISRFDPATLISTQSSNTHYCVKFATMGNADNTLASMYYLDTRYKGATHLLATTSST